MSSKSFKTEISNVKIFVQSPVRIQIVRDRRHWVRAGSPAITIVESIIIITFWSVIGQKSGYDTIIEIIDLYRYNTELVADFWPITGKKEFFFRFAMLWFVKDQGGQHENSCQLGDLKGPGSGYISPHRRRIGHFSVNWSVSCKNTGKKVIFMRKNVSPWYFRQQYFSFRALYEKFYFKYIQC